MPQKWWVHAEAGFWIQITILGDIGCSSSTKSCFIASFFTCHLSPFFQKSCIYVTREIRATHIGLCNIMGFRFGAVGTYLLVSMELCGKIHAWILWSSNYLEQIILGLISLVKLFFYFWWQVLLVSVTSIANMPLSVPSLLFGHIYIFSSMSWWVDLPPGCLVMKK